MVPLDPSIPPLTTFHRSLSSKFSKALGTTRILLCQKKKRRLQNNVEWRENVQKYAKKKKILKIFICSTNRKEKRQKKCHLNCFPPNFAVVKLWGNDCNKLFVPWVVALLNRSQKEACSGCTASIRLWNPQGSPSQGANPRISCCWRQTACWASSQAPRCTWGGPQKLHGAAQLWCLVWSHACPVPRCGLQLGRVRNTGAITLKNT